MDSENILTKGYCRCTLQEKFFVRQFATEMETMKKGRGERVTKIRENPFCIDITFLISYTLLAKEEFFLWQAKVSPKAKQEWRKTYLLSKYRNEMYEAFFDMRAAADLDWLTGMLVKIRQGKRKEYWELMNGISFTFPWEQRYIEKKNMIPLEELIKIAEQEEDVILRAGKLLILFILVEFYQKQIPKSELWNRVDYIINEAMELYYYGYDNKCESNRSKRKFQNLLNKKLLKHGIHPNGLKKYTVMEWEIPEYQNIRKEDWVYLWKMVMALEKCICENKRMYWELKRTLERKFAESESSLFLPQNHEKVSQKNISKK